MSKENVTDFTISTQTKFLTISEDGEIEVPLTMEQMEKLYLQKTAIEPGLAYVSVMVPEPYLILLVKEILKLRIENKNLRASNAPPVKNKFHTSIRIKEHFTSEKMYDLLDLTNIQEKVPLGKVPYVKILDFVLSSSLELRNHIIAFLEQPHEP